MLTQSELENAKVLEKQRNEHNMTYFLNIYQIKNLHFLLIKILNKFYFLTAFFVIFLLIY